MQGGMLVINDSDCGFTINGVNYTFSHVDSVAIENPEKAHIVRGANSASKTGLQYKEGSTSPKILTFTMKDISSEFFTLLSGVFAASSRLDAWVIDRATGSHKTAKNSILQSEPRQLNISEGEDNLKVEFIVETFDLVEQYKE
jgi:hypothetical protein